MTRRSFRSALATCLVATVLSFAGVRPAAALQPLSSFLTAARTQNLDVQESRADQRRREIDREQSRLALAPTVTIVGGYTRNQYEVKPQFPTMAGGEPRTIVIMPHNQLDATFSLVQPVIDVGAWMRLGVGDANLETGRARTEARQHEVGLRVVQAYYQLVAAEALGRTSRRSLEVAQESLRIVGARSTQGLASEVDVKRAAAEVERVNQTIADADYQISVAARSLETLSGLAPEPGAPELAPALVAEAPLERWLDGDLEAVPTVRAAVQNKRGAQADAKAARGVLIPVLNATATERITNATGFLGKYAIWSVGASLSWRFDATAITAIKARRATEAVASIQERRERRLAADQIHAAWHQARAALVKAQSSRVALEAHQAAATAARQRYEAGSALLLEVVQADRDVFGAEISRIQADADLMLARDLLRMRAGRSTGEPVDR